MKLLVVVNQTIDEKLACEIASKVRPFVNGVRPRVLCSREPTAAKCGDIIGRSLCSSVELFEGLWADHFYWGSMKDAEEIVYTYIGSSNSFVIVVVVDLFATLLGIHQNIGKRFGIKDFPPTGTERGQGWFLFLDEGAKTCKHSKDVSLP